MVAISFGILWGGYTLIWYGIDLIKDWGVPFGSLVIPGRLPANWHPTPGAGATGTTGGHATSKAPPSAGGGNVPPFAHFVA